MRIARDIARDLYEERMIKIEKFLLEGCKKKK